MKKIIISICLLLSFIIPSQASSLNFDIETQAINWMMNSKTSNGVAIGEYGPNYPATWAQIQIFCNRLFGSNHSASQNRVSSIDDACGIILNSLGIVKTPNVFWPETEAVKICKICNIIPKETDVSQDISRGEVAIILYKITHNLYDIPKFHFPIVVDEGYFSHELEVMPYILELYRLPEKVLKTYHSALTIGIKDINEFNQEYNTNAVGVCYYTTHRIAVTAPQYLMHEFGHFWDFDRHWPKEINKLYLQEADNLAEAIGWDYCTKDRDEFYAEAFNLYINNPDLLQTAAPGVYIEIENSLKK